MPNYLERVVTSGARTRPTARPPLTIVPPLPVPIHPAASTEAPAVALEPWPSHSPAAAPHPGEATPPAPVTAAAAVPPGPSTSSHLTAMPTAQRPEQTAASPSPASVVERVRHPGEDEPAVIRAPRGLRTEGVTPAEALGPAPLLDPLASPMPPPPRAERGSESPATRVEAADVAILPRRPPAARPEVPVATGQTAATSVRPPTGAEVPGTPRRPDPGPSPRATSGPASDGLLPAPPAAAGPPLVPRLPAREPRITIGRIDVEVHNEAPPPPAPTVARPVAASAPTPRLASRFLLKP